jgi:hypothetical protein
MCYRYVRDEPQIREWVEASQAEETTRQYFEKYVYSVPDHRAYLEKIGAGRLKSLSLV